MKTHGFCFSLLFAVVMVGLMGCGQEAPKDGVPKPPSASGNPATDAAGQVMVPETKTSVSAEDVKKEKEEFQKKMRAELDRMQGEIDQLAAKAKRAKKEAQAELKKATTELQEQKEAAGKKLKELESETGKAWSDLKSGLNATMGELERSFKRARARFP